MNVDFDHSINSHTVSGSAAALPRIFDEQVPASLLDVGCGIGTWLKAALDFGVAEVQGIDGVEIPPDNLLFPAQCFRRTDLTQPVDLGRRFEAALCLEVGEHLEERHAATLVDTLTRHADVVLFSAACPMQPGQNHVNGQWPAYWQTLFNERQFACDDELRWRIWDDERIEPWYRQNIFAATKDPAHAGKEERIRPVIHPDIYSMVVRASSESTFPLHVQQIEQGRMPLGWYLRTCGGGIAAKLRRNRH